MSELLLRKVDARGRYVLETGLTGAIDLLIRLDAAPTDDHRSALREAGCTLRSTVGNVLSASSNVAHLEQIAQLSFVRRIELSRPLFVER